jgi:hypothetical protein
MPELERLEVDVDRLGALQVDDRRENTIAQRRVEVGAAARDAQVARALEREQPPGAARRVGAATSWPIGSASARL